jgi:hypothetical protein
MEQRARLAPVPFDRPIRASQHLRGLFDRETAEIPQFDDAAEPLVEPGQAVERLVERNDVRGPLGRCNQIEVFDRPWRRAATTLAGRLPAGIVERQLPHRFGGNREEMMAILHLQGRTVRQLQKGFVHHRRRLERVVRPRVDTPTARDGAQLVVDERHQAADGVAIAAAPLRQQGGDVGFLCQPQPQRGF